jgi:hypothetical protein
VHGFFNARSDEKIQLQNDDGDLSDFGTLVVFMHVPRTSGDSMQTHLFNDVALDTSPKSIWPHQYLTLEEKAIKATKKPLGSFLSKEDLANITSIESTRAVVKGFFSAEDLIKIKEAAPHRDVKTVVFVRHPLERFLSFYSMIKPVQLNDAGEQIITWTAAEFAAQIFDDSAMIESMPEDRRQNLWRSKLQVTYGCTFLNNSMAWQLGHQQHCAARKSANLADDEVVQRAKDTLQKADFVGFYETIDTDFSALRREIFHEKYIDLDPLMYHIFNIGTHFGQPRLQVKKHLAAQPEAFKAKLEGYLALDMEVYEWVRCVMVK